ncbi:MAG TPA: DUF4079 domain-containing protein [Prochlorococcus sp.]
MQTIDWIWLLHPILAVALIYPLLGVVLSLSLQTRNRRLKRQNNIPAKVGREHSLLGRWLSAGVVSIVLLALAVMISSEKSLSELEGGINRAVRLLVVLVGSCIALISTWRDKRPAYRASCSLLCWAGVIYLGMQPEVYRLSDNPLEAEFWQSHFWGGVGLVGLMLLSLASRQEIVGNLAWRWVHITANCLAVVIFVAEAITGPKALLEIPLNWQKPLIQQAKAERGAIPVQKGLVAEKQR